MFTGLIQNIGTVRSVDKTRNDLRLGIETGIDLGNVPAGASIACSGVCLTVTQKNKNSFFTDVSAETLNKTLIGEWKAGTRINIEPSLRLGDELGGHFVFGHADGVAEVTSIKSDGAFRRMIVKPPAGLLKFIASKGSVALDGVSLTINELEKDSFGVNIIPHTLEHTTLGYLKRGDKVNIEIDMLARYTARILEKDAA
ncbi:MAG: riboflavin synthase [Alphaproteobacteria bacterium]|nr:riboflavin synthase [Alphaproteobacteria bacterium]